VPYAVRHTWATNRLLAGVDPFTVAVLMGHRDTTVAARVYQHLKAVPEHLHDALRS
jgi:site-specific recombinase XerD